VKIHGQKLKVLCKEPEEWADQEKSDHPYDVQREKLRRPMPHLVEELIHQMDPVGQFGNINKDPNRSKATPNKEASESSKDGMPLGIDLLKIIGEAESIWHQTSQDSIYFSRKDGELPIVIDSGAS
jgi:hypothetical protein